MREELCGYRTDDKRILCDQWHETLTQRYLTGTGQVRAIAGWFGRLIPSG